MGSKSCAKLGQLSLGLKAMVTMFRIKASVGTKPVPVQVRHLKNICFFAGIKCICVPISFAGDCNASHGVQQSKQILEDLNNCEVSRVKGDAVQTISNKMCRGQASVCLELSTFLLEE